MSSDAANQTDPTRGPGREPTSERTYDFMKDAEDLRRLRANPPARDSALSGFTVTERFWIRAFYVAVFLANIAALWSFFLK